LQSGAENLLAWPGFEPTTLNFGIPSQVPLTWPQHDYLFRNKVKNIFFLLWMLFDADKALGTWGQTQATLVLIKRCIHWKIAVGPLNYKPVKNLLLHNYFLPHEVVWEGLLPLIVHISFQL